MMTFFKKLFGKKKTQNDDLYSKVEKIIRDKSISVDDYFINKKMVANSLKDLTDRMKNMSSEEIKKMVNDELNKNKEKK
jgi:hypothetical protein